MTAIVQDQTTAQIVRVTQLSGDVVALDFTPGMTLGDYLKNADVTVGRGQMVTVNGQGITDMNTGLEPGDVVVVVGKIANG